MKFATTKLCFHWSPKRVCKSTLNIETNIETLKKSTLTLTLYQIQCFRVNILKNCSMFSMSKCFSMFLNFFPFFDIFGQKGRLNFDFRTNFTLLIKNLTWDLIFAYSSWTIFCYLKMLTIFEKIATLKSTLKYWKHWLCIEFQCSFFLASKTLNRI